MSYHYCKVDFSTILEGFYLVKKEPKGMGVHLMPQGNQPVKKFKAGAISATVFKNEGNFEGKISVYYSIVFDRVYKDREGNWQNTNNLRYNDLPKAQYVLGKAFEFLTELRNERPVQEQHQQQPQQPQVQEEPVM